MYFRRAFLRLKKKNFVKKSVQSGIWVDILDTITVISLHEHYLFRNIFALIRCTKSKEAAKARVGLFVSVSDTHSTTNSNIEAFELAVSTDDGDETHIIGKDVNIVRWRNRYCNFELGHS